MMSQQMDGPALATAMQAAKVSDLTLMLRTRRSAGTVSVWKRDGVPGRMKERVLGALAGPAPADERPRRIPASEFRALLAASGLKQVALERSVPVGSGAVRRWTLDGVQAAREERVRYLLAHPCLLYTSDAADE